MVHKPGSIGDSFMMGWAIALVVDKAHTLMRASRKRKLGGI
jgi:hypothetical protein